jgi:hypothetical protein
MKHRFAFSIALAALLVSGLAVAGDPAGTTSPGTSQGSSSKGTTSPNPTSRDRGTTSSDHSSKDSTSTTAPAEQPGMLSIPHHVTGSVVSVDKKAHSVNVRDAKGKELTLVADTETATEVGLLKAGDQVKITYKKNRDQMVVTKIDVTSTRK